jgi:hypothetical protein
MILAIGLSLLAWFAGYAVWHETGSVVLGAIALVLTTILELVAGLILTRRG